MCICNLKPGDFGYIESIVGNEKLAKRLQALGCVEGTRVEFKASAPLGDPIIINFRGFNLAIRKKDTMNIHIKEAINEYSDEVNYSSISR